jgi:hypothetical protein
VVGDAFIARLSASKGSPMRRSPDGVVGLAGWSTVAASESSGMFSATC